jgi:hypothetical protein
MGRVIAETFGSHEIRVWDKAGFSCRVFGWPGGILSACHFCEWRNSATQRSHNAFAVVFTNAFKLNEISFTLG